MPGSRVGSLMTAMPVATMPMSTQVHHQHEHDKSNGEKAVHRYTCEQEAFEGDNERYVDAGLLFQHQELLGSMLPTLVEGRACVTGDKVLPRQAEGP